MKKVDYEKIPFKHKFYDEYGHFSKGCSKRNIQEEELEKDKEWNIVSKNWRRLSVKQLSPKVAKEFETWNKYQSIKTKRRNKLKER